MKKITKQKANNFPRTKDFLANPKELKESNNSSQKIKAVKTTKEKSAQRKILTSLLFSSFPNQILNSQITN